MQRRSPEQQYLQHLDDLYHTGYDVYNKRTGQTCRTLLNLTMEYDASTAKSPLGTTRKLGIKNAIGEQLGYICGVTDASIMETKGAKTWYANANDNRAWLANKNRLGRDDMGLVYGAVSNKWPVMDYGDKGALVHQGETIDLWEQAYAKLSAGVDDRGVTVTYWNPGVFHLGCLRPCLRTYTFSILNDTLYLTCEQRSADWLLGTRANMVQAWVTLRLMAQICNLKPGKVTHHNINCHLYENQLPILEQHREWEREPMEPAYIHINPEIKTLDDIRNWVTVDDFKVIGYKSHGAITYPFSE